MSRVRDYEDLEAVVLDYIQRYGLTEAARKHFLLRQAQIKDDGKLALDKTRAAVDRET